MLNAARDTLSLGITLHNPLSRSRERVGVRVHEDRKHEYGVVKRILHYRKIQEKQKWN